MIADRYIVTLNQINENRPEEDEILLVFVLPQKRHQIVELVFRSTDLK